jgi:hypothetical protein
MPKNVARFEWLSYLSLMCGSLSILFNQERLSMLARHGVAGVIGAGIGIGLSVLAIFLIARLRQNWARWLFGVLFLAGLPSFIMNLGPIYRNSHVAAYLEALAAVLALLAFWFVFTGNASSWFKHAE